MSTQDQKEKTRSKRLQLLFNLTLEDYELILKYQENVCFICRKEAIGKRHAVDHEHSTGLIRGLLCMRCNRAIAKFRDNAEHLARAAAYLLDPPATLALGGPRFGLRGRTSNKAKTRHKLNPELGPVPRKPRKKKRKTKIRKQ
jgi:Recombination endonuclease VII